MGIPIDKVLAWEVIFTCKSKRYVVLPNYFNNNPIKQISSPTHQGMNLDTKLNFQENLKNVSSKVNKALGLLRKLQNMFPQASLLTILKMIFRPHFDSIDVICDQSDDNTFHQ